MNRIPFSQVLQNASVDIQREYSRLYYYFGVKKFTLSENRKMTIREICEINFMRLPFRGTCLSLDDFDETYKFHFVVSPDEFDLNYLILFCEYSYNLAIHNQIYGLPFFQSYGNVYSLMQSYLEQITKVIDTIGYTSLSHKDTTIFVPRDQTAISVAEIVDSSLSYKVIEYNHHSMKGDCERKRAVLLALADKLEPRRKKLKAINSSLESELFCLFNNINIRHNNADREGRNYNAFVAAMDNNEVEHWYDEVYQMCLLAFLELDHMNRKENIKTLIETINQREL